MKVLFLNPTGRIGGAETALLEVVAALLEQRPSWRLGLITASDGPLVARARAAGVDVRVLPFPPALARLGEWSSAESRWPRLTLAARCARAIWPAWRYLARLRTAVRELAPEIVHTNGLKMHVLGTWARPSGTPMVWHLHDYATRRPLSARALAHCARRCAALVAPSGSVAADVRAVVGTELPIYSVWNAVDLDRFSPGGSTLDLDARCGLPPSGVDLVRVGLVATFAHWKGHRVFLEAIARLQPSLPVRAYVIGGPVYETDKSEVSIEELQEAVARLGISDRVGFSGFIDDPAPAIRTLDVQVHASTEPEPFGLAIAEGMACGRAVVVSRGGGSAEIVTAGVDALTFTPGDPDALAACITQLALDADRRQQIGRAARATAERSFTRRRLARQLLEVYDRIAPETSRRVLHLHSGNLYGGVETFLTTLARHAAVAPGMVSSFAVCFEGQLSEELLAHGHRPHMLGAVRLSRPYTVWRARRRLARLLRQQRVDVVVCHQAWPYAIFAPVIRRARLPSVFWLHTAGDGRHWLERWARRVTPDLAVANSQFTSALLAGWFTAPLETIYYPLRPHATPTQDLDLRDDIRRSLDTGHHDVVIVQVGRLEPWKGNREALAAMAGLRDVDGWKYWIVGAPQRDSEERYLRELKDIARRGGISDRVRFAGARRDVPALLQAADIYCQPNTLPEPFGLSLVEAQGAGLPIVTSSFGGALEIVDHASGLLVAPLDIEGLAEALRRLVSDAGLRARLGQASRARAGALCDLRRQMHRIDEVLSGVANRPRQSSIPQHARPLESAQP